MIKQKKSVTPQEFTGQQKNRIQNKTLTKLEYKTFPF